MHCKAQGHIPWSKAAEETVCQQPKPFVCGFCPSLFQFLRLSKCPVTVWYNKVCVSANQSLFSFIIWHKIKLQLLFHYHCYNTFFILINAVDYKSFECCRCHFFNLSSSFQEKTPTSAAAESWSPPLPRLSMSWSPICPRMDHWRWLCSFPVFRAS